MKKIFSLLFVSLIVNIIWAQSGEGYDPENPADPNVYYSLALEASPRSGGSLNFQRRSYTAGTEVYCYANAKSGYAFKQWMIGDSIVSTDANITYTMPATDVVLTAYFDFVGYNPQNPDDPFADGYQHKVHVYAVPSSGGYFNSSTLMLTEGERTNLYAYARSGYRFVAWKQDGQIVSMENPLTITMRDADMEYTATFVYDPQSPGNPSANVFNSATGELIIDDFKTGYLNNAISSVVGGYDNMTLIQSVKVIGQMNSNDYGFYYRFDNCSLIDLARTTGYTEIPAWAFESMTALTKIILPSSVTQINSNAFRGCENLSELVCYATVPPRVSSGAFAGLPSGLVVRVPSSAMSLYINSDDWKEVTLLPLDEETCAISVNLPPDAADGRYKNMTLELKNISSGQVLKYLITDRTKYNFANLVRDTKYNLFVKNHAGAILGSILNIELASENVDVAFESLLQPQNITLILLTDNNEDVTDKASVTWLDSDSIYIGQGASLNGIIEGSKLYCHISIPEELALNYIAPQNIEYLVKSADNRISCVLQPHKEISISGVVKDLTTGTALQNAIITISQKLNGKHYKSQTVRTDSVGAYNVVVYDAPLTMTVAANNYLSNTFEIKSPNNTTELDEIFLKGITGAVVNVHFTYQESVVDGNNVELQDGYTDYANVTYSIYNVTQEKEIKSFKLQYPSIVLLEEVSEGDIIRITAKSKKDAFVDVVSECFVNSYNRLDVTFPIVQLGGINVNCNTVNNINNIGVLYDNKGQFVRKNSYEDLTLSISDIPDGDYTLVSMGSSSKFFSSILNIDELSNAGLTEGMDYVMNQVTVNSGKISSVAIETIPAFDETRFYYTGSNTSFTANKPAVTVGNYITLRGKVDFKSEYSDEVSDIKLLFDLPDDCNFVDNSVLAGRGVANYSVERNRVVVDVANIDDQVRFCVKPTIGGQYKPNAFVQFRLAGETILQPIGSAYFEAENMKITVPEKTAFTSVVISGVATADSEIKIYDNDVLVGQTYSIANGQWSSKIELYKPYSRSTHSLYAEVTSKNGEKYLTDTKLLSYGKSFSIPSKITMLYNGTTIVFDQLEGRNSTNTYSYDSENSDFTFVAEFTKNDTTIVKEVEFVVLASDGTTRRLSPTFNGTKGVWVANSSYGDSNKLPVNVNVEYDLVNTDTTDLERYNDDVYSMINLISAQQTTILDSLENFEVIDETENSIIIKYQNDSSCANFYLRIETIDYNEFVSANPLDDFITIQDETYNIKIKSDIISNNYFLHIIDCRTNSIYKVSLIDNYIKSPQTRVIPALLGGAVSVAFAEFSRREYERQCESLNDLYRRYHLISESFRNKNIELNRLLNARCQDGSNRVSITDAFILTGEINRLKIEERNMEQEMETILMDCQNTINYVYMFNIGLSVTQVAIGLGATAVNILKGLKFSRPLLSSLSLLGSYGDGVAGNLVTDALLGDCITRAEATMTQKTITIGNQYWSLIDKIKATYKKCPKKDEDEDKDSDFPNPPITPAIDPAGYVYEGVSSNRVEGVTATAYYKEYVENMYGDLQETIVKWNAEDYAQKNPLFTDENGMYRWDVPQGMWQVKFEKEGYETTYSEWLPVPPPQLEVNIAMTQNRQPEVKSARAFGDAVEIEFDKYMMPEQLTTENIFVMDGEDVVEGNIALLNEEVSYEGETTKYASKVRFNSNAPFANEEITLHVSNRVKSYAGIRMENDFVQKFAIELEVEKIEADSTVNVFYGDSTNLTISVLPAKASAGKTLTVRNASSMILGVDKERVIIDEKGNAVITVRGELPGTAAVVFGIEGYDLTATTIVTVEQASEITKTPTANIASGTTVEKGTEITLSCSTPNAVIYYTLDGSCPCDNSALIYDGTPIVINETTTLKIMAVAPDMYESEIVEYIYIVDKETAIDEISIDDDVKIYPLPIKDKLNISTKGKIISSIQIINLNGAIMRNYNVSAERVSLDVRDLSTGTYIINIVAGNNVYSKKVIKIK